MNGKDVAQTIGIAFNVVAGILDGVASVVKRLMTNWDAMSSTAKRDAHEVAVSFDALRSDIANWAHDLASYFSEAAANVARWAADVQRDADNVVKWFQQLPGRILSALAALPGMLFRAGQHAVQSLIDGMGSMLGDLGSMGLHMASKIAGFFGLSPAKEGPLSGAGAPEVRGAHFTADFARGMTSGLGGVTSAASRIAGAAAATPGAAGAGAGGGITIEFHVSNAGQLGADFWKQFQNGVRVKGGDPNIVTKKVLFK